MLLVKLAEQLIHIELFAQTGVQLANSSLDLGPQNLQCLDTIENLATELLLRRFGKRRDLAKGYFQRFDHAVTLAHFPGLAQRLASNPVVGVMADEIPSDIAQIDRPAGPGAERPAWCNGNK
jgi:hypothetical protein